MNKESIYELPEFNHEGKGVGEFWTVIGLFAFIMLIAGLIVWIAN